MARKINTIEEINDSKETWKIAVRVISLCRVDSLKFMEMVLMDAKGHKIQAVARNAEMVVWKPTLKEGETYVMQNFCVLRNDGEYKTCDHPFKLQLTGGTTLKVQNLSDISTDHYQFRSFCDILSGKLDTHVLIDVIGSLHDVLNAQANASLKKISFLMKDLSGDMITCTLWGDYATKLLNFRENHPSELTVIILTHAKIKEPEGMHPITIQNSMYSSKLLINEDIAEIQQFKDSFKSNQVNEPQGQTQSQTSGSSFSEQEKLTYRAVLMSIADKNCLKEETTCVTVGTIARFVVGKSGWSYQSCSSCTRKAEAPNGAFTCRCGKYNHEPVIRYRLEVMLYNKKDCVKIVLWDQECIQLLGKTANELRNQMIEEGEDDPLSYPETLDDLLGRTLAFRIKMQPAYSAASVQKVSEDETVAQSILGKIDMDEQSLSAIADHDPESSSASVTPCKRSSHMQSDDSQSPDEATQLSATKIQKRIKKE
ncbi:unnamed protein product [Cuscuta epithymum]|uniref:Replication factor A C-terminal domain-containing protein n=1 Tax=Cuscuta epithymum TaxID=186058 RepID=A0AAV0DSQ8_9ASTE|nr:unnamed protein product [Cuscuta epithymum]